MKVLMVSKAMVFSAYRKKIDEMLSMGVDVGLVAPSVWEGRPIERDRERGCRIHVLRAFLDGRNHFHFYAGLRQIFEQERPDLVHIDEEPYSLVTWQALREARRIGAPAIFYTWQNIHKRFPPPFNWIEQNTFRHCVLGIAGNEEAAGVLRRKGFDKPVPVVPQFGVDPDIFTRRQGDTLRKDLGLEGRFVVGYLGRLLEEKGIASLVDAFECVASEMKDAALLVRGSGPLLEWLKRRSAVSPVLRGRVQFLAALPSEEVPRVLSAMDCLVLPSLTRSNWKEQFGRVLIEAMACRTPVIGSSSGEIPTVIGDAGLVFPEGDADALADRISRLMQSPAHREELARRGRERVLARYTQDIIAAQTIAAYEAALLSRNHHPQTPFRRGTLKGTDEN